MITTTEHIAAEAHKYAHGPNCGREAMIHFDHVDYVHDGHAHREHDGHYDECTICICGNRSDAYVTCICEDCAYPTCSHNACSCSSCDCFSCSSCACEDYACPTCHHVARVQNLPGP